MAPKTFRCTGTAEAIKDRIEGTKQTIGSVKKIGDETKSSSTKLTWLSRRKT